MPKLEVVNANNVIEYNPQKANFKLKNTGGPKGEPGAQGPQGPKGDTGAQGPAGASASVTVGSTTTLSPGADATVTNSGDTRNAILNFGIPTGARGPKGDTGSKGDTGPMGPKGAKGDTGSAATVQVGNTNTGAPGTNAQVTNAGNEHFAVFNFTIPRGDKGETGSQGPQGPQGPAGQNGTDGQDGADGFSPIATVTQEGLDAEISITDKNGTTTATVPGFGVQVVESLPATGSPNVIYLERDSNSASGNPISIADAVEAPLKSLEIKGNTSQDGTPTPSAPVPVQTVTGENVVKICGKNLFDKDNANVINGYIDSSHDYITSDANNRILWIKCEPNTQYAISALATSWNRTIAWSSTMPAIGVQTFNRTNLSTNSTSTTFTTGASANYLIFRFWASTLSPETYQQALDSIQIELGSATDFEPYQGQSYEVNLGKNLLDMSQTWVRGTLSDSSVEVQPNDNTILSDYIKVEPNTTYVFSQKQLGGKEVKPNIVSFFKDKINVRTGFKQVLTSSPQAFTTSNDTYYIRVGYYNPTGLTLDTWLDYVTDLQLEVGSTATVYAPYFTPIELCKIGTYQDYIYKSGADWKIHKEVDRKNLNGSEGWGLAERSGSNNGVFYIDYSKIGTVGAKNNGAFSNYARFISGYVSKVGQFDTHYSQWRFYAPNNTITLNEWKAKLGATPLDLYYLPATPTDTEITNAALIAQLEAILAGGTNAGTNNITLTPSAGATGTLEVEYYDSYDSYLWVNNRWEKFAHLG